MSQKHWLLQGVPLEATAVEPWRKGTGIGTEDATHVAARADDVVWHPCGPYLAGPSAVAKNGWAPRDILLSVVLEKRFVRAGRALSSKTCS